MSARPSKVLLLDLPQMRMKQYSSLSVCSLNKCQPASNVVSDGDEIWRSANIASPHWLLFELPNDIEINKVSIEHDKNSNKMTVEYIIETSDNMIKWRTIKKISNNEEYYNEYLLEPICCKYFRIYITIPSKWFVQARIRKITIWGNKVIS